MSQPPPAPNSLQVAVIGGGVCGLTCAVALQRLGMSVQLFEAAAAFGEIGAGIGIGPNAVRVLDKIGVLDEILKKTGPAELKMRGFQYIMANKDHETFYTYETMPEDSGIGLHRATFLDALVEVVDPRITHFNKRCTAITESPTNPKRLAVHFRDGTTHDADVVLGADGIKSTVREYLLGKEDKRIAFSNTVAYRALIPYAKLKAAGFKADVDEYPACLCGPSKHIIMVPIKNGEIINVVAFSARYDIPIGAQNLPEGKPWVQEVTREEMAREYEGWSSDVAAVVECMPEKPSRWSIHVVSPPLESFSKGHVALLGDAAHGMLPHLGAGAGQGLEDAYVLAKLLSHPETNAENIEAVLKSYAIIRQPRAQMVWEGSRYAGSVYDFQGKHGPTPEGIEADLQNMYNPVWHHSLDDDLEGAVASLRESGAFAQSTAQVPV